MALVYPATGGGGTGGGTVKSVTAADTSVVVGGTAADPTVRTATLDVIAADHPAAADWSNNAKKITGLAAASAATDAASLANTLNQFGAPAADVAFNAKKITGLANGSAATDAQAYGQGVASLLTAAGDTVYASAANTLARLAKGSDGQVLTLASGVPSWAPASGGISQSYIGYNTAGGTTDAVPTNNSKLVWKSVTLAAAGLLVGIDCYIKGNGTNVSSIGAGVYSDNAGAPGNVIAVNIPGEKASFSGTTDWILNVSLSTTARWVSTPIGIYLAAGTYWLAIIGANGVSGAMTFHYDASGGDFTATGTTIDLGDGGGSNSSRKYSIRGTLIQ